MDLMRERLFIVCLLSGLSGAVSELMPVGKLDDNLVFPVVSASVCRLGARRVAARAFGPGDGVGQLLDARTR